MLTPMDIHNKEFKRSFRGYNEDEIDEFLDQVVNDYEKLYRENDRLKEEVERIQKNIEQYQRLEKNLQDTLLVAQKTAEEVVATAKKNAEELRETTAGECRTLKENTLAECQNMRRQTEIDTKRQLDQAAGRVRAIVAEYDHIAREKNKFLKKLRVTLESELAIVSQALEELPNPEQEELPRMQTPEKSVGAPAEKTEEKTADRTERAEKTTEVAMMDTVPMEKVPADVAKDKAAEGEKDG